MDDGSRSSSSSSSSASSLNDEELAEVLRQVARARLHLHSPGRPLFRTSHPQADGVHLSHGRDSPRPSRNQPLPYGQPSLNDINERHMKRASEYVSAKLATNNKGSPSPSPAAVAPEARSPDRHEAVSYRLPASSTIHTRDEAKHSDGPPRPLPLARQASSLPLGPDGFISAEELRLRREARLEKARMAARRNETFHPNTRRSARGTPPPSSRSPRGQEGLSERSIGGGSAERWETRLHDESFSQRQRRLAECEAQARAAQLQAELEEKFKHCTFHPETEKIHAEKRHLKKGAHVERYGANASEGEKKAHAGVELYEAAKSSRGRKTALEAQLEYARQKAAEESERRQRAASAKAAAVHLRLYSDAAAKRVAMNEKIAAALEATSEPLITYPIKSNWYTIKPTAHSDPESFSRLHDESQKRDAAHAALQQRHKPSFAPSITAYAETVHGGRGDPFTRLASTKTGTGALPGSPPLATSPSMSMPANIGHVKSLVVMSRHHSRMVSRVVTPEQDALRPPEAPADAADSGVNLFIPPPLQL
jgi:hypothetical protein